MLDQHKVLQVLINLVANAREAVMVRPAGKREITVSVGIISSAAGDRLRYQVTDNGMGIAPEHLTRIFSHGFTTKKDGHGFGLHSAANAAKEMDGSLSAISNGVGHGAIFSLDLPVNPVEEGASCKI
jgi:C4-dicarboxylate-specific signal transduction histidine kinase